MTAAKAQNNKDYYFKYSKICYKNNKNYYLKFATKIIKITIFNIKNPTFRVCPSAIIKIINFLIKRVKFINEFFSVYGYTYNNKKHLIFIVRISFEISFASSFENPHSSNSVYE